MAHKSRPFVLETSTTTGTGDISLDGAYSADWHDFDDAGYVDGDTAMCHIQERDGGVEYEEGLYTYRTGPRRLERTRIDKSTNGDAAVSWPVGTRQISVSKTAKSDEDFTDPGLADGFLVKTDDVPSLVGRSIATDDATRLPITNGDGQSGNPTISGSWLASNVLDRSAGASAAQRTMSGELILAANETNITGFDGANEHEIKGQSDESLLRIKRDGASDYRLDLQDGSSWERIPAATPANPGDDGKLLVARGGTYSLEEIAIIESDELADNTTSSTGVVSGLSVAITVPNDSGAWDLTLQLLMHYTTDSASSSTNILQVDVERDLDGGGYSRITNGRFRDSESDLNTAGQDGGQLVGIAHLAGVAAGTHTFRVNITAITNARLMSDGANDLVHQMIVRATKVAG